MHTVSPESEWRSTVRIMIGAIEHEAKRVPYDPAFAEELKRDLGQLMVKMVTRTYSDAAG